MRLFKKRFRVSSRSPKSVQRYDISGVVAHPTIPTDCGARSSSAFPVNLGLNCSTPGPNAGANLVDQTGPSFEVARAAEIGKNLPDAVFPHPSRFEKMFRALIVGSGLEAVTVRFSTVGETTHFWVQ